MRRFLSSVLVLMAASALHAQETRLPPTSIDEVKQIRPGVPAGYLPREQLVNSLLLLGAPPQGAAADLIADEAARQQARGLRETPRWRLAARDADYTTPRAVEAFACALGANISPAETPHLYMLMRRSLVDAGLATYRAKDRYARTRPFVAANDPDICSPKEAEMLRKDGSYPSGHAAFGWAWALILAEIAPDRADALIQRGYDYGQSRVVCGVHWQSDVNAGRLVGAAVVAQLHASDDFRAQLGAARKEVEAARAKAAPDCALEQEARAN